MLVEVEKEEEEKEAPRTRSCIININNRKKIFKTDSE